MITQEHPELADDPVWQSFVNAPAGPAETEEQRRWSEEAELEERALVGEARELDEGTNDDETFELSPEEEEELEKRCARAEEAQRPGELIPWAKLSPRGAFLSALEARRRQLTTAEGRAAPAPLAPPQPRGGPAVSLPGVIDAMRNAPMGPPAPEELSMVLAQQEALCLPGIPHAVVKTLLEQRRRAEEGEAGRPPLEMTATRIWSREQFERLALPAGVFVHAVPRHARRRLARRILPSDGYTAPRGRRTAVAVEVALLHGDRAVVEDALRRASKAAA